MWQPWPTPAFVPYRLRALIVIVIAGEPSGIALIGVLPTRIHAPDAVIWADSACRGDIPVADGDLSFLGDAVLLRRDTRGRPHHDPARTSCFCVLP